MKFNTSPLTEAFSDMDKRCITEPKINKVKPNKVILNEQIDIKEGTEKSSSRPEFITKDKLSSQSKEELKKVIKDWYIEEFPHDELGIELLDDFTFEDLFDDLTNNVFGYECCADDSVVRERVFQELANILKVDYDVIYYRWIDTDDKPEMKEGLKETWSHPWDGLKGQEKLDAIKKFCAENPSLDPARVLCSDDGLAQVEEEPIVIGDYKFVQEGRAWNVYKNDEFLYTGTRAAVCRHISDLWEKDLYKTESVNKNLKESSNKDFPTYKVLDWEPILINLRDYFKNAGYSIDINPLYGQGDQTDFREISIDGIYFTLRDDAHDQIISVWKEHEFISDAYNMYELKTIIEDALHE